MTLAVCAVHAGYGRADVLDDVSIDVAAGETVALLGPNGAGKSTLVHSIAGVVEKRRGSIRFEDRELIALASHRIVEAGLRVVPEGRRIFAPLPVIDNLRLGSLKLARERTVAERLEHIFTLFPRLKERRTQIAGTLSGGEQQMLAIGRALMSAPRMLLLDEPFLGLAPKVVEEIVRAVDGLRADGLSVLLVEQKVDLALGIATRAYVMVKGRIVHADTTAALRGRDLSGFYFAATT